MALNLKYPSLNSVSLTLTDLHLNKVGLLRQCPWQHPWVTEAGSEQHGHYEDEEQHCKHRDGRRQVHCQVRAPVQDKRTSRVTKDDKGNMKLTAQRLNEHLKLNSFISLVSKSEVWNFCAINATKLIRKLFEQPNSTIGSANEFGDGTMFI